MNQNLTDILAGIEQQPSSPDGTLDQLRTLRGFANRLGFYDAADFLRNLITRSGSREIAAEGPAPVVGAPVVDLHPILAALPKMSQRQDGTNDQLADLRVFAVKLGLCDAAGYLRRVLDHPGTQTVTAAQGVLQ